MSEERKCLGCGSTMEGLRSNAKYCSEECGRLWRTYGIGVKQWQGMYDAQGGKCAVCRKRQRIKALSLDHDHKTGRPRGLLCLTCNHEVVGAWAKDDPAMFDRGAAYLRHTPFDQLVEAGVIDDWQPKEETRG